MRVLALIFVLLILALQYPMWLGKGGWLRVRELDRQVDAQKRVNADLQTRNAKLDADGVMPVRLAVAPTDRS